MDSRYHKSALELLGRPPTLAPVALARVEVRERDLGFPLPAAVREWYALEAGREGLLASSGDDAPLPLETLGDEVARPPGLGCDLLVLAREHQGLCTWAAPLDGSEDPPVLVQVDGRRWQVYVTGFSTFAYVRLWDGLVLRNSRLAARDRSLFTADLARLRRTFTEVPKTKGWPAQVQYRFERRDQRILIVDDEVGQADWWLAAGSEASLSGLAREVWGLGGLARTLHPSDRPAVDAPLWGERVLRELRGEGG